MISSNEIPLTGSIAFVGAARAAWLVAPDKEDPDRKLFLPIKSNLAKRTTGLAFRIVDRLVNGETVGCVEWEREPIHLTADEALSDEPAKGESRLQEAITFLQELLTPDHLPVAEVKEAAEGHGIAWGTVTRAKKPAGVVPIRSGFGDKGGWLWSLPGAKLANPDAGALAV